MGRLIMHRKSSTRRRKFTIKQEESEEEEFQSARNCSSDESLQARDTDSEQVLSTESENWSNRSNKKFGLRDQHIVGSLQVLVRTGTDETSIPGEYRSSLHMALQMSKKKRKEKREKKHQNLKQEESDEEEFESAQNCYSEEPLETQDADSEFVTEDLGSGSSSLRDHQICVGSLKLPRVLVRTNKLGNYRSCTDTDEGFIPGEYRSSVQWKHMAPEMPKKKRKKKQKKKKKKKNSSFSESEEGFVLENPVPWKSIGSPSSCRFSQTLDPARTLSPVKTLNIPPTPKTNLRTLTPPSPRIPTPRRSLNFRRLVKLPRSFQLKLSRSSNNYGRTSKLRASELSTSQLSKSMGNTFCWIIVQETSRQCVKHIFGSIYEHFDSFYSSPKAAARTESMAARYAIDFYFAQAKQLLTFDEQEELISIIATVGEPKSDLLRQMKCFMIDKSKVLPDRWETYSVWTITGIQMHCPVLK